MFLRKAGVSHYTMKLALLLVAFFTGVIGFAQTAIDREELIVIGGIKQYITLQGKDTSLPLLLFLHGGPGGSVMNYSEKFTGKLQSHFIVVQWDQRETGRTLELNASTLPLSLSRFQEDAHALIDSLLKRFSRQKLYLAGHSWGTALGFHIARKYPERLYAYIPIGPMINQLESERIILAMMMEKARKEANAVMLNELVKVNIPFQDGEQLYYHRKWLSDFSGSRKKLSKEFVLDWSRRWLALFNEASGENLIESLPVVGCPVYFLAGRHDYQTNSSITDQYFQQLRAPKKALYWFEKSGHSIPTSEPERMQDLIIEKILPETFTIDKAKAIIGQTDIGKP